MKRAAWYVVAGTVAGFAGVVGLHGRAASPSIVAQPKPVSRESPPSSSPSSRPAAARRGPAAPSGAIRHVNGVLEQYGYGELSVRVTVRGSQITDVSVPVLRTEEPYSQQLAQQVIPMLRHEVLTAHNARVNAIGGATYTSLAYEDSIQSALDKLHLK